MSAGPALLTLCILMGVLLLATAPPVAHATSGDLAWQRLYNGAGNSTDKFAALAPAPNGDVYAAGFTISPAVSLDILVARYNAAGHRRWLRTYNDPLGGTDFVNDATTDPRGNLVVVGVLAETSLGVLKYGTGGQLRWVRSYYDPASTAVNATDVAVDGAGNVYAAGFRLTTASGNDMLLVKYSPAGKRLWVRTYGGPGNEEVTGVATDAAENVYLTGYGDNGASGNDILTIKYSSTGHRRWLRYWDGPASNNDYGYGLAVTRSGASYVAGQSAGIATGQDAVVVKYGSNGTLEWSRSWTGAGAFDDAYTGIALLRSGDVAATGSSDTAASSDALVVRLAPNGHRRWVRLYGDSAPDAGERVAGGPAGAVYVTGYSIGAATAGDVLTLKYDAKGRRRWARTETSAGSFNDAAYAILAHGDGVYVAGYEMVGSSYDAMLLKYRP